MALHRFQVTSKKIGGLAIDDAVNVLYYEMGTFDANSVASVCDDILSKYEAALSPIVANGEWTCKGYSMADAKPRPVKGQASRSFGGAGGQNGPAGPREVCVCLSYYAGRNLPRDRGRIYLGPFLASTTGEERPNAALLGRFITLGNGLASVGESAVVADSDWVVFSPTRGTAKVITNIWVDNEWDTQRRRGLKATSRLTAAVD